MATLSRPNHNQWVATSYDGLYPYFRLVWTRSADLAIHCGYWGDHTRTHSEALINLNRVLAERAAITSSDRILDAGCGIGGSSIWLVKTYDCSAIGITVSRKQAYLARGFAAERQVASRTNFGVQDYTAMALPGASFDVVWVIESVCHAQVKRPFFDEAWRVLKPGGRLIMTDWLRRGRDYSAEDESLLKNWLSGYAIPDLDTPNEYKDAMCGAGFIDIQFENISAYVRRSLRRAYLFSFLGIPITYLLKWAGLQPEWLVRFAQGTYVQYKAFRRGLWMQVIFSAHKEK